MQYVLVATPDRVCRHCLKVPPNRPKGLCWNCYYTPGVRELYPSTSKFGRRSAGSQGNARGRLPDVPTNALPGTPEKIAVLTERARAGCTLFHPLDVSFLIEAWRRSTSACGRSIA
jgi:hypothetical protein